MKTLVQNSKVTAVVFVLFCFFLTSNSFAQVTTLQAWSNVYNGTSTTTQNITYTVPTGSNSNRVLVVAIASSTTAASTRSVTLTYGTQAFTASSGDMGGNNIQHTEIYYFNEAALDAATNSTLSVRVQTGTTTMTDVWVTVLDYVDQTTPVTNSRNLNSGTTAVDPIVFGTALNVNANDQAVEIIDIVRVGSTTQRTISSYATNWTSGDAEQTGTYNPGGTANDQAIRTAVANRSIPVSNTTDVSSVNLSGTARASMTAISFKGCVPATANAGSALTAICQGGVSAALGGSVGGSATGGTWSSSVAGGTFTPSATNLNATWTPPTAFSGTATLTLTTSGGSCGTATASKTLRVNPVPTAVSASSSASAICSGGNFNLTSSATSNSPTVPLLNENFNSAPVGWTTTNTSTGGTPASAAWSLIANGTTYDVDTFNSNDNSQFYLSNSDAQGSGSTTATTLQSPSFSTFGLSAASLSFFHYFRNVSTDTAIVQVSTDGVNWTAIATYTGTNQGASNAFAPVTISLASYLNQPTVSIRFKYDATWDWYWAIDNVTVTGTVIPTTYAWTSTPSGFTSSTQNPTGVSPMVSTAYSVEVTNAFGCKASASTASITVRAVFTSGAIGTTGETLTCNADATLGINSVTAASGGDNVITYKWQANGVDIPGSNSATFDPPPGLTVTTTYTRFAKDNTCNPTFTISTGSWVVTVSNVNTWTGSVSTSWTTTGNWSCNSVPTSSTDVVIGSASFYPVLVSDVSINSLTLNSGTTLKVNATYDLTVTDAIVNNGTLTIENNANLLQVNNVSNTGSGSTIVKRNSSALKRLDYTLWSSPVTGQGLYAFSPFTFGYRFYVYNTSNDTYNNSVGFSLTGLDVNGVNGTDSNNVQFAQGKGYLIRMPWNHPTAPAVWNGSFTGVPNNGNVTFAMTTGYNAVGNPYPSRLNVKDFIDGNANISGPLYLWRKTNDNASTSYATLTKTAYVANGAAGGDTGTGFFNTGNEANWVLNIGQGFIVNATSSTNLTFTNGMRRSLNNDQFFKSSQTTTSTNSGLYWLNLNESTGIYSQMAVGYSSEGTLGEDRGIDGKNINPEFYLTSLIGTEEYSIQGRPDFENNDIVPLSYKVITAGNYTISIDHTAGLFSDADQAIYLKDNVTATEHDLRTGAYSFTSAIGTFTNRFEIIYQSQLANPVFTANAVVIYNQNNGFVINSGNVVMASIKVFDIRGRLIEEKNDINTNQTTVKGGSTNQVLLVQITSEDGVVVTKKVIR